jgi:NADH-quinone oxidoreductase subunit E
VAEQGGPVPPVFDELTRQRTKEIIARYPQSRSALLPLLHLVQSVQNHVSQEGIRYCAEALELTTAEVSAVATFYTMYKRTPCGEHLVSVCTNTLCATLGGDAVYARLKDSSASATRARRACPALPGRSPSSTPSAWPPATSPGAAGELRVLRQPDRAAAAEELVDALQARREADPTAGARSRLQRPSRWSWPGLPRPGAGRSRTSVAAETLRGARLAADRGWLAPPMPDSPPDLPALPEKK